MSCEVEHIEIVLQVRDAKQLHKFYRPILESLGYTLTDSKIGLSIWSSASRSSRLVLVETAAARRHREAEELLHTNRLTFSAQSIHQVDQLYALLKTIGGTVLIEPRRYARGSADYGVVFCCADGAVLELRFRPLRYRRKTDRPQRHDCAAGEAAGN